MKWKSLLKQIAIIGVHVSPVPGPVANAVDEIFADKNTSNDEGMQLMAQAIDAISKRVEVLEQKQNK